MKRLVLLAVVGPLALSSLLSPASARSHGSDATASLRATGGTLRGVVYDSSGSPAPGAHVVAYRSLGSYDTTTAADGSYQIDDVAPGSYLVSAAVGTGASGTPDTFDIETFNGDTYRAPESPRVFVESDQESVVTITTILGGRIAGVVRTPSGAPSARTSLLVEARNGGSGSWTTMTDQEGQYSLPVAAGQWLVLAKSAESGAFGPVFAPTYVGDTDQKGKATKVAVTRQTLSPADVRLVRESVPGPESINKIDTLSRNSIEAPEPDQPYTSVSATGHTLVTWAETKNGRGRCIGRAAVGNRADPNAETANIAIGGQAEYCKSPFGDVASNGDAMVMTTDEKWRRYDASSDRWSSTGSLPDMCESDPSYSNDPYDFKVVPAGKSFVLIKQCSDTRGAGQYFYNIWLARVWTPARGWSKAVRSPIEGCWDTGERDGYSSGFDAVALKNGTVALTETCISSYRGKRSAMLTTSTLNPGSRKWGRKTVLKWQNKAWKLEQFSTIAKTTSGMAVGLTEQGTGGRVRFTQRFATYTPTRGWRHSITNLTRPGRLASVALDSQARPTLAWRNGAKLYIGQRTGSGWVETAVSAPRSSSDYPSYWSYKVFTNGSDKPVVVHSTDVYDGSEYSYYEWVTHFVDGAYVTDQVGRGSTINGVSLPGNGVLLAWTGGIRSGGLLAAALQ